MMDTVRELVLSAFRIDSFASIVLRGVVWFVIAMVIIISADTADADRASKNLRSNLGFTIVFLVLTGGLIYLLFGFTHKA